MDSTPNNGKLLFDVGGTFLKAVIADGNGRFVPDTEYSVPMPSDGPREEIEQALIAAVERGMRSAADRGLRIGCTGIAFPGPFDFGLGIPLMTHKFRNIYGISLLDLLRTRTDVGPTMPVLFMHDVNAAMLGEMRCGNARGFANAALIALGTGLAWSSATGCGGSWPSSATGRSSPAVSTARCNTLRPVPLGSPSTRNRSATESSKIMSPNADSYDSTAR